MGSLQPFRGFGSELRFQSRAASNRSKGYAKAATGPAVGTKSTPDPATGVIVSKDPHLIVGSVTPNQWIAKPGARRYRSPLSGY